MKNKGIHTYRLATNPLEQRFAEMWEHHNKDYPYHGFDTVDSLMSKDSYHPDFATDEQREAMATVIQWLGSPVGQTFLSRVLEMEICK